jgi:hypothetical protein
LKEGYQEEFLAEVKKMLYGDQLYKLYNEPDTVRVIRWLGHRGRTLAAS